MSETSANTSIKDFEAAIAELETVVKKLEEGDLVARAIAGAVRTRRQLSRFCHARLEDAERRIELLNERGDLRPAPAGLSGDDPITDGSWPQKRSTRSSVESRRRVDEALDRYLPIPPACPADRQRGHALQPVCRRQTSAADPDARRRRRDFPRGRLDSGRGVRPRVARGVRHRAHSHLLADS